MSETKQPTAKAFRALATYLRENIDPETTLYMKSCATCVAGEIGRIAQGCDPLSDDVKHRVLDDELPTKNMKGYTDWYSTGRKQIADILDIGPRDLERWARANPDLWGNKDGHDLFSGHATGWGVPGEYISIKQLIGHIEGVADRVAVRETIEANTATVIDLSKWRRDRAAA